jgi:MFS family permease
MRSTILEMLYHKTIELIFGSLLFAAYYILSGEGAPFLAYFLLTIPPTYGYVFIIERYREKSNLLFFLIIFPLIVALGLFQGFSIYFVIMVSIIIYWRVSIISEDKDCEQSGFWLFITTLTGFLLFIVTKMNSYPDGNSILIIVLIQLTVIIIGGFILNWFSITANSQEKRQLLRSFLSIMGIIVASSLLVVTTMNLIKWIFVSFVKVMATSASFLASPLFKWVERYELAKDPEQSALIEVSESESDTFSFFRNEDLENVQSNFDPTFLYIGLFIVLCTIIFLYIYKKFRKISVVGDLNNQAFSISSAFDEKEKGSSRKKWGGGQPTYRIRKEIYLLEKHADKLHLGRYSSETIAEWFERIGLEEDEQIQSIYEKVRYGNLFESNEEYNLFLVRIGKKKSELKLIHKQLFEEGKIQSPSLKSMFKR